MVEAPAEAPGGSLRSCWTIPQKRERSKNIMAAGSYVTGRFDRAAAADEEADRRYPAASRVGKRGATY
jgi:hypothetical protein